MNTEPLKLDLIANQRKSNIGKILWKYRYFYLMLFPVLIWYLIFCYFPIYGSILAFKEFDFSKGIWGSPWVGWRNFADLLRDYDYWTAFKNTLWISCGKLLFCFPAPIVLAVLLNEIGRSKLKKFYQTVFTFPHFLSWVVLSGIIINILASNGLFNQLAALFGYAPSSPLTDPAKFRAILYISQIWKEIGWDAIIYLAALAGINPELYEAAEVDGANRLQRMLHITWPGIRGTVTILFILTVGQFMSGGGAVTGSSFDQVVNLYNPSVYQVGDIIDTFIYRISFTMGGNFGYMTAAGLIKSVINLTLLYSANSFVKKLGEPGLF